MVDGAVVINIIKHPTPDAEHMDPRQLPIEHTKIHENHIEYHRIINCLIP